MSEYSSYYENTNKNLDLADLNVNEMLDQA